eukprot:RCo044849
MADRYALIMPPPPPPPRQGGLCMRHNRAQEFRNEWAIGMCETCKNCPYCCLACFFPWCMAFTQRKRILLGDLEHNYVCCGGMFGRCSECATKVCSGACGLALESCCCLVCAVTANRWMIQSAYQLQNTPCDDALIILTCVCSFVALIVSFVDRGLGDLMNDSAQLLLHMVLACMLTQQDFEMTFRNYPFNSPGAPAKGMAPEPQQMK